MYFCWWDGMVRSERSRLILTGWMLRAFALSCTIRHPEGALAA